MNSLAQGTGEPPDGARTFQVSGNAYDAFMGRYSQSLAVKFADLIGIQTGMAVLDVGCGPGALTSALIDQIGASAVSACDPSPAFLQDCRSRHPDVNLRQGRAESIPFEADTFDAVMAQLVLHFVREPAIAAKEFRRVLHPDGVAAACVWDFAEGMQMLRYFWDAALVIDSGAPDEARTLRFGREGEIAQLLEGAGFQQISESTLTVSSSYTDFDELWSGFMAGIGPAGAYLVGRSEHDRAAIRAKMLEDIGSSTEPFTLEAVARCAWGRSPG